LVCLKTEEYDDGGEILSKAVFSNEAIAYSTYQVLQMSMAVEYGLLVYPTNT